MYYHDYLLLEKILSAQVPKSLQWNANGTEVFAHDEMLFIIIHQTYELWFKEILHDLDSIGELFGKERMSEMAIGTIVGRLQRIVRILQVLVAQMDILETMSPVDFLDFRDFLFPASGFESLQFRLLENKLGLQRAQRLNYHAADYTAPLIEEHRRRAREAESLPSLFDLVEKWLERTPFLDTGFPFWQEYQKAVSEFFAEDRDRIQASDLPESQKNALLKDIQHTLFVFNKIFDEKEHAILLEQKKARLSWRATQAALLILLYKEQPIFQIPYQLITLLQDLDEQLTTWRSKHAMMVHRMLGSKLGTGGSSGFDYLKATVNHHKIFADFSNLSMFLIPRSSLPKLPPHLKARLSFNY